MRGADSGGGRPDANWCEMRGRAGWIGNVVLVANPARFLGRIPAFAGYFGICLCQALWSGPLSLGGCPGSYNWRGRQQA